MEIEINNLDASRRVLGTEQQYTLSCCMNNLACTYYEMNRTNEAIGMMEQAATLQSQILGIEHQHTKNSMEFLHRWKEKQKLDDMESVTPPFPEVCRIS